MRTTVRSNDLLKHIATLGFIGYLPLAPGTFGSLFAFLVFVLLRPSLLLHAVLLILLIPVAILSAHSAELLLNEKDSRHIVIDEFCGYFASVIFLPFSIGFALSAFFLFRVFDILKPFPIGILENSLKGGKGIVADDIAAAVYVNLLLQIWRIASPGFL